MDNPLDSLTARQLEVLDAICAHGDDYDETAARLFIARSTVRNHMVTIHNQTRTKTACLCWELGRREGDRA